MRILKIIKFLKSIIYSNKSKINEIEFINHSYLPDWRKILITADHQVQKRNMGEELFLTVVMN